MNKIKYQQRSKVEAFNLKKRRSLGYRLAKNYGIGYSTKRYVFEDVGLNCRIRISKFRKKHVKAIKSACRFFFYGGLLKIHTRESLVYMIRIKSYRGNRHQSNYPSRGQRTHTNGKTRKKFSY